jgi:methionyl-tRNA formyltransferase
MSLRVLFFGTPEFALPSLEAVRTSHHPLAGVVTVPDRPRGRGRKPLPSPIKEKAASFGVPVLQPEKLDDPVFLDEVTRIDPDIFLVVAFRILPDALFERPPRGAVNVHASLLPAYRGAAPIARALMDGCEETGVTTFQITRRVDTGGILLQERLPIAPSDNAGTLGAKLARAGAALATKTLDGLAAGTLVAVPQNHTLATRAPKLTAEDRPIRWTEPARVSHNRVRGLSPAPGATIRLEEKILKLLETDYDSTPVPAAAGTVIAADHDRGIATATGSGTLYLRRLQPENRRAMSAQEYLRGHALEVGTRFQ